MKTIFVKPGEKVYDFKRKVLATVDQNGMVMKP